ncbi:hypothetical protein [Mycolicibacterium palauense]|uniref:hypothetical protein n=1 Tax=Mycolicibacterium palauense TaxID=2034511 RepID=UPI000BFF027B|nr:hypothetical protein [Mycolicibacterium palauense]
MTIDTSPSAAPTDTDRTPTRRPGRLVLRRRLLLWSSPVLVLLVLLAVKLASVGVLGDRLPAQFHARDRAGMESTLHWIDLGKFGRGYREQLAAGDMLRLGGDDRAALEQFAAAHAAKPSACPPRANFALTSELLSDRELKQGNFFQARTLLEPAVQAAVGDKGCFTTSPSPTPEVRAFVAQTPDRLSTKLAALTAGAVTETPDGFDYIRTPGGGIDFREGEPAPCPFDDEDDARLRECIKARDEERAQRVADAQGEPAPDQPPSEPDQPPAPGQTPPSQPPSESDPAIEFPGDPAPVTPDPQGKPTVPFCTPNGTPLGDLGAALCTTSGPLP